MSTIDQIALKEAGIRAYVAMMELRRISTKCACVYTMAVNGVECRNCTLWD